MNVEEYLSNPQMYCVYDLDNNLVFTGTCFKVGFFLGCLNAQVYKVANTKYKYKSRTKRPMGTIKHRTTGKYYYVRKEGK